MIRRRKRLAGFLILALALAAGYAIIRPRPDLVPYTTPWLSDGEEEVRVSLIVPINWHDDQPKSDWMVHLSPDRPHVWPPRWLYGLLRISESGPNDYLIVDSDAKPTYVNGITEGNRYIGHILVYYSRDGNIEFARTSQRILNSARIVERRPLHR